MRYVIDIDETICVPGKTEEERYTGATPIKTRIDIVNRLYDEGNTISYLTARCMGRHKQDAKKAHDEFYDFTKNQLDNWGCKYHALYLGKPASDYYIDDIAWPDHVFFNDKK